MAVIGLGNALTDIVVTLTSDEILTQLGVAKGGMHLIDIDRHHQMTAMLENHHKEYVAGGSAANALSGIARLGTHAAYVGHICNDQTGREFEVCQAQAGIKSFLGQSSVTPSGKCISLVSPDGERTMLTYLGAALEIDTRHLSEMYLSPYNTIFIEGYLLNCPEVIEPAMQNARQCGLKVALDASSFTVVEAHREYIDTLIDRYVDILFANEDEAAALTGSSDPRVALEALAPRCEYVIVKIGAEGSLIAHNEQRLHVGVIDATPRDKTGAGDLYAAGFLHGMSRGLSLAQCGQIGAVTSSRSIEYMGAQIPADQWGKIRDMTRAIEAGDEICTVTNFQSI